MKNRSKNGKLRANGSIPTRVELLAAQERSIRRTDKMTAQEGFEVLVRAGIYTREGKLTRYYGGKAKDPPPIP
jgi:hypothetical protein